VKHLDSDLVILRACFNAVAEKSSSCSAENNMNYQQVAEGAPPAGMLDDAADEYVQEPFGEEANRILAVCQQGDKLGICVYLEDDNVIKMSQDLPSSHADIGYTLECFKTGVNPTLILTTQHISGNAELLGLLTGALVAGDEPFQHKVLKNACWDYGNAVRTACAHLRVRELVQAAGDEAVIDADDDERAYNLLSGAIDFSAQQSVRALGALLGHMQVQ
jgi:hypothetical protein